MNLFFLWIATLLTGCTPREEQFPDDGLGSEGGQHCFEVSKDVLDFGTFAYDNPPQDEVIYIDLLCEDSETDENIWTLDDPDKVFEVTSSRDGDTFMLTIRVTMNVPGDWEAQIIVDDAVSVAKHRVQLFAKIVESEPNE